MGDSDGEEEWLPDEDLQNENESRSRRVSRRAVKKSPDYVNEKRDEFFDGRPGYTSFGRTRKRGDRRPRAVGQASCITL